MSKISIEGNASGTGTLTIAAPNTNTNRTLTLPDSTGTIVLTQAAGGVSTNTAVGTDALAANTTGANNTAVGYQALDVNTTGAGNTAVGSAALGANTTGADNTAVGYGAGDANTTGRRNAFFGVDAGGSNTTGESNTYIGRLAGSLMTTGTNNTIIGRFDGNQSGLDIRTANNYIVLSDGDGNPRQVIDNNATSKLKQYLLFNGQKNAVPSGSATNLFRITSPTGQIYGPLMIQFAYDQPGVNLYAGTITGRAFWNGSTALYDNTTTTGNTVTWSVTGSGNDLTFRVTQGTGANVNFSYTVIWTQYQTGGLTGVDTTTIVGL